MNRSRWIQAGALVAAAALLAGAGMLQGPLEALRAEHDLAPPATRGQFQDLLTIAPGGLRALIIDYLWITSNQLKEEGRFFDAMQRASLICDFQPQFAAVWDFQAWNMAWNISVATHTPEERWMWVTDGIRLLRDRGIPYNPKALGLYKNIAWIFFSKMGGTTDQMHWTYKRRWAKEMQDLLAAPPFGRTEEALAAFRPVAEAPLDKDPRRGRRQIIQADKLAQRLADPAVAEYANALAKEGVKVDETLLSAYNRYSRDAGVRIYRGAPRIDDDRDRRMAELVNDPRHADAREKLLAFVRAQVLWNRYKMDPQWMLELMEKYGPLDWRLVVCHALYWATYGAHVCQRLPLRDIDSMMTDRIVLYALKWLTFEGRLTLVRQAGEGDGVIYVSIADPRFIDVTNAEYRHFIDLMTRGGEQTFKKNVFRDGHINYVARCVESLYALGAKDQAERYWRYIRKAYDLTTVEWAYDNVDDFVLYRLRHGDIVIGSALSQITLSLAAANASLAAGGHDAFDGSREYAALVHRIYNEGLGEIWKGAPPRSQLPPFPELEDRIRENFLVMPGMFGFQVDLLGRARLYAELPDSTRLKTYDWIEGPLRQECVQQKLDFDRLFPAPPGLEEYRKRQQEQLVAPEAP